MPSMINKRCNAEILKKTDCVEEYQLSTRLSFYTLSTESASLGYHVIGLVTVFIVACMYFLSVTCFSRVSFTVDGTWCLTMVCYVATKDIVFIFSSPHLISTPDMHMHRYLANTLQALCPCAAPMPHTYSPLSLSYLVLSLARAPYAYSAPSSGWGLFRFAGDAMSARIFVSNS